MQKKKVALSVKATPQTLDINTRLAQIAEAGAAAEQPVKGAKPAATKPSKELVLRADKAKKALAASKPVKRPAAVVPATTQFGAVSHRKVGNTNKLPLPKITAWSYSRFTTWAECPLKAKYKFVDGLKEPGSAAMDRGSAVHQLAQDYAEKKLKKLPDELAKFSAEFKELVKQKPVCESQWAFTNTWEETGWFEKGEKAAWCRVVSDVYYIKGASAHIIDHKTGKPRASHADQLSLYALAVFIKFPKVQSVTADLWYLDTGDATTQEFHRSSLPDLIAYWNNKVKPMLEDTSFVATPTKACAWCHFRKGNGGPCKW